MTNIYDLYRYHELKKRLEKIEERLNNDWFISEYVSHTLEKEKEDIYDELIRMEREKLVWEIYL